MEDQTPEAGGVAGDESSDLQDNRGMKRKLFRQPFGPKEL